MPLDPVIAAGVKPVEIENPLNAYARMMTIQNAQSENALRQMQMQRAQRDMDTENALRGVTAMPGTPEYVQAVQRISPAMARQAHAEMIAAQKEQRQGE